MAAAAQTGADCRSVPAGDCPDGYFCFTVFALAQGGCQADTLNGSGIGRQVAQLRVGNTDAFLHGLGNGHNGQFTVTENLHMLRDPGMEPQLGQRIGLKQLQIQSRHIRAGTGAGRRGQKRVGIGVGIAEAAGIRGHTHIDGIGNVLIQLHTQEGQQVIDDFRAGSTLRVHQLFGGEGGAASVVVDAEQTLVSQFRKVPGQHIGRRHIHRQDGISRFGKILGDIRQKPVQVVQRLCGVQDPGIFAQLPQS